MRLTSIQGLEEQNLRTWPACLAREQAFPPKRPFVEGLAWVIVICVLRRETTIDLRGDSVEHRRQKKTLHQGGSVDERKSCAWHWQSISLTFFL